MFGSLEMAPPDAILGLNVAFRNDPNPNKINLGVGVYKDETGNTPVLECVKKAEQLILERETSKSYLGIDGLPEYGPLVRKVLFDDKVDLLHAATLQTPGGTGALRVAGDFLKHKAGASRIWLSNPTWANHNGVFSSAGLVVNSYTYLDDTGLALDFQGLLDSISQIPAGDVICLHACCHNPSGVDPSPEQWEQIVEVVKDREILPLIDFAYQGFANGLREDASVLRLFADKVDEFLVCSSFSKNFGLYCERIGALTIVAEDDSAVTAALSHAKKSVRTNYSNPPKHGGAVVATVLGCEELFSQWDGEVTAMRERINGLRKLFVDTMAAKNSPVDFSFIQQQRGMFSYSGLNPMQVDQLKNDHSIYVVGSGRINVAGLNRENVEQLCDAILQVL
ncbi:MAG: amino acid aminotransferase [Planctomycetota bacterium]|nr:amino acid aminotransferase [Planctomycetota bacterium]